jgi:hypothetical protein
VKLYTQQHTAEPDDGHTADGTPGDCLRAAVATVLQEDPANLRHYAQFASWWDAMRFDARTKFGLDWSYTTPDLLETWTLRPEVLMIASGASPRGPFQHVVVVDQELEMVHDPHPSRAGVLLVDGLFILCQPYAPAPAIAALVAA